MIKRVPIRSPLQKRDLVPSKEPVRGADMLGELTQRVSEFYAEMDRVTAEAQETLQHVRQIQKGEVGEPGEKGDQGVSIYSEADLIPYLEWMVDEVKKHIPLPLKGDQGIKGDVPTLGVDYFTEAHKKEIVSSVLKKIKQPADGKTPIVDHSQIASDVIGRILTGKLLTKEHVTGLEQELASYRNQFAKGEGYVHGGGDTVAAGVGVTITRTPDGKTVINAPGSGGLNFLLATGTVDNSNKVFTFAGSPTLVVVNGATYRNGFGVTIVGTTATLDNAVGTGGDIYGLG